MIGNIKERTTFVAFQEKIDPLGGTFGKVLKKLSTMRKRVASLCLKLLTYQRQLSMQLLRLVSASVTSGLSTNEIVMPNAFQFILVYASILIFLR